ncbi:two-component sensor histidine kinase, partial [Clostridium perfringens]|nr:two-component sensor histidine kinase [Clostridium perfringens]
EVMKRDEDFINADKYVEGLLNEQVWKYGKYNMKPELYVISENDLNFSTYAKNKYNINSIKDEIWYNEIVEADGNTVLISTFEDEEGIGPYKCIFRMGRLIKDLITDETLGVLIMDVSEKMLYDRYNKIIKDGRNIYIIDLKGDIISSRDKRLIGNNYYRELDYGQHLKTEEWYSIFERDGIKYMKMVSTLDRYGWSIVEEIPLHIVRQPIKQIPQKFSLTLILVIIISFIF